MKIPKPLKYTLIAIAIGGGTFIVATLALYLRYGQYVGGMH